MSKCKNPYLKSRLKRSLDISVATIGFPAYLVGIGTFALMDISSPTTSHKRSKSDGTVFEIAKFNTRLLNQLGGHAIHSGFDEIPQLTNILNGDMSVVGPRPMSPDNFDRFLSALPPSLRQKWQAIMPGIKPGIISTYSLADHAGLVEKDRAEMDIFDAKFASFVHDISLIIRLGRAPKLPQTIGQTPYSDVPEHGTIPLSGLIGAQSVKPIMDVFKEL